MCDRLALMVMLIITTCPGPYFEFKRDNEAVRADREQVKVRASQNELYHVSGSKNARAVSTRATIDSLLNITVRFFSILHFPSCCSKA